MFALNYERLPLRGGSRRSRVEESAQLWILHFFRRNCVISTARRLLPSRTRRDTFLSEEGSLLVLSPKTVEHVILSGENDTVCHFRSRTRPKGGREAGSIKNYRFFVRDPKQCFALFDPRFARISTDAQDDTDEKRSTKSAEAKPHGIYNEDLKQSIAKFTNLIKRRFLRYFTKNCGKM